MSMTPQHPDNVPVGPWGRRDGKIIKAPLVPSAVFARKSAFSSRMTRHLFIAATLWVLLSVTAYLLPGPAPSPLEPAPKPTTAIAAEPPK